MSENDDYLSEKDLADVLVHLLIALISNNIITNLDIDAVAKEHSNISDSFKKRKLICLSILEIFKMRFLVPDKFYCESMERIRENVQNPPKDAYVMHNDVDYNQKIRAGSGIITKLGISNSDRVIVDLIIKLMNEVLRIKNKDDITPESGPAP